MGGHLLDSGEGLEEAVRRVWAVGAAQTHKAPKVKLIIRFLYGIRVPRPAELGGFAGDQFPL